MADLPGATRPSKPPRPIPIAVIRQDAMHADPASSKPLQRAAKEVLAGLLPLRPTDFDVRESGRIINGDMHVFPSDAARSLAAIAVHAVTDTSNPPQRLDIQVKQITGMRPFVALDDRLGLEPRHAIEAGTRQHARDR
jgi:hypothetical protein